MVSALQILNKRNNPNIFAEHTLRRILTTDTLTYKALVGRAA